MSNSGTAVAAVVPAPIETPKRQCRGRSEIDPSLSCSRRVTWRIESLGDMCNLHFERYFDANWRMIPIDSIQRLSDNEKDFLDHKSGSLGSLGGRPRKHPLPVPSSSPADPPPAVTE